MRSAPHSPASKTLSAAAAKVKLWWLAARPKTLTIAVVPVLVGTALAWSEQHAVAVLPMLAALLAAVLIQAGTNLHNDAGDFERGADKDDRQGPPRAIVQGWVSVDGARRAAFLCFLAAFAPGVYLVWAGGWPILLLGLASIAAGVAYTGGPRPIAYTALGDLFVFLFFGLVAVTGSYYLQTFRLNAPALIAAAAIGLLAAAVLVVNNYRDLDSDRRVGKNTLAVRIGRAATRLEYGLLMIMPFVLLVPLYLASGTRGVWLAALLLPWAVSLLRRFTRQPPGPALNGLLAETAQLQLTYGLLLSAGLLL